jgi:hypothetical protein
MPLRRSRAAGLRPFKSVAGKIRSGELYDAACRKVPLPQGRCWHLRLELARAAFTLPDARAVPHLAPDDIARGQLAPPLTADVRQGFRRARCGCSRIP